MSDSTFRTIAAGYANELLRQVRWTSPLDSVLSSQCYIEQIHWKLDDLRAVFSSALWQLNIDIIPLPTWFTKASRKQRRKAWRRIQNRFQVRKVYERHLRRVT